MATTPRLALPYPEGQHVPDVPKWNGDLANAVEGVLRRCGQSASARRGQDDSAAGWGNFTGTAVNCPAGTMLGIGMARWGGKDAEIQLLATGNLVLADVQLRNYQVGQYVTTLMGVWVHPGGVANIGLQGTPLDGETLGFYTGSSVTITYLGPGMT